MKATKSIKKDRYPGIRSFEVDDERLFKGRTKEIDDLFSQVVIKPLVVLFSKSGLGKSSLLKAGLGPVLVKNAFFPIMIRVQDTGVSPMKMLLSELKPFVDAEKLKQFGGKSTNKIWESINAGNFTGVDGNPATPVLIFDQFEELFHHKRAVQDQWASQLADLIEGRLPRDVVEALQQIPRRERTPEQLNWFRPPAVKIVFAIRSDRMSELHQLRKEIPGILQNRYELKPLHAAQSAEAMEKPAALTGTGFNTKPFSFAPETVKDIQSNLSNEAGEIESFQLQIVCQHIEQKVKELESDGAENIKATPDFIGGKKGILAILKNYYDDHITDLGGEEDQLAARKLLEEGLIADGRRIGVADAVVKGSFGISDELLEKLLESRLIRPENTRLGRTFEISHDTLVAPILKSYDKRRRAEARIAKQKELEERERELAKEQKKRIFYYKFAAFAGILSFFAIGAFVFAIYHLKKSKFSKRIAESSLEEVKAINAQNEKIINSFYFYGDSLALASKIDQYGRTMYGYINKKGEALIDYRYSAATPFGSETGYAIVEQWRGKYLLWPDQSEYQFADNLEELGPNITALDLTNSYLSRFPSVVYQQSQLEVLLLRNNRFQNLPDEIERLTKLQYLDLNSNRLQKLPSQIGKLEQLEQLHIMSNSLHVLPLEIGSFGKLRYLNLHSNKIENIPIQIGELSNLEILNLAYNELANLPTEIGTLEKLRELDLSYNKHLRFPREIGELKKLEELNLENTAVRIFPPEIEGLVALKKLDLSRDSLKSLPPGISKLKNLEELFLYGNELSNLPKGLGNLNHLKKLNLERNLFIELPVEIVELESLNNLNLASNKLNNLSSEIGNLKNLDELWLSGNRLRSLPLEIGKLEKLGKLFLTLNQLSVLLPEIGQLKELQKLYLDHNQLQSLPPEIGQLEQLQELWLDANQLKNLPPEIGKLQNLRELLLSDNLLQSLPPEIGKLQNLRELHLQGNPISNEKKQKIRKLLPNCNVRF